MLRDYQLKDLNEIKKSFDEDLNKSVLYVLPTGGGKSVIVSEFVSQEFLNNKRILVLAHRLSLLKQLKTHFNNLNIEIGLVAGKIEENINSNVLIGSINTLVRDNRFEEIKNKSFDYVIIDEAHRTASESYEIVLNRILDHNPNYKLLGVTATPIRKDKKPLNKYYEKLISNVDTADLISMGYLSNYKIYGTPTKDIKKSVERNSADYKISSLSSYMKDDKRIEDAVNSFRKYANDKQSLIFCVDRSHAKIICERYNREGWLTAYIDGLTPEKEREKIFNDYTNNLIQNIVSIETMIEGVDFPETKCVQLLRPTLSLQMYLQMVGRGLRLKSDGDILTIIDNAGCVREHGTPSLKRFWSLDGSYTDESNKKKILVKKTDGDSEHLEEDLDSEYCDEIVEIDLDQYIESLSNSLEKAIKHNELVDKEVLNQKLEIGNFIIEKSKLSNILRVKNLEKEYEPITLLLGNGIEYVIEFSFSRQVLSVTDSSWGDYNRTYEQLSEKHLVKSKIYDVFSKFSKELIKMFISIETTKGKKIDINLIKNNTKEKEKEKFIKQVEQHLAYSTEIQLTGKIVIWDFFSTYVKTPYFDKIIIHSGKIAYKNKISLMNDSLICYESNSTKKEKLIEILWECKNKLILNIKEDVTK